MAINQAVNECAWRSCPWIAITQRYDPAGQRGGPDGSRDIDCLRLGSRCFGAVGFLNSVSDSSSDKSDIKKKFKEDVLAARRADQDLKYFVFLCNVDLTPTEVKELEAFAESNGFSSTDIYWRSNGKQGHIPFCFGKQRQFGGQA